MVSGRRAAHPVKKESMPNTKPVYPLTKIVEVFWVDSASRGRWDSLEGYRGQRPALCKTCGYLVDESNEHITVALSQGDTTSMVSTVLDSICIPRGCVTKIRRLT